MMRAKNLTRYIAKFYDKALIPSEVLVPSIADGDLTYLIILRLRLKFLRRVLRRGWLIWHADNARKQLEDEYELVIKNEEKTVKANDELREVLGLREA